MFSYFACTHVYVPCVCLVPNEVAVSHHLELESQSGCELPHGYSPGNQTYPAIPYFHLKLPFFCCI